MTKIELESEHGDVPRPLANTEGRFRRVSIQEAPYGHDNPAFEAPTRKISTASDHAEIGPVRKKSILYKASELDNNIANRYECSKQANGDSKYKAHSISDSLHSKSKYSEGEEDDRSWWYTFCLRCRSKDEGPSWSPQFWSKVCPYPFCPTYRQFTRIISICLIGILSWCILYSIVGDIAAPPDGKLFQILVLTIGAYCGGWVMSLTTLPALIGMLFTGLLFQNINIVNIDESFSGIAKELRSVALVIILTRAGLDLDPNALRRLKITIMKIGLVPWLGEALAMAIPSKFFLGLPWIYAILLGAVFAAVSPAVVVPCLFRLRTKGYGVAKGIPTLIIAISGIDDAISVAFFGIVKSIMFSSSSLTNLIIEGPVSIVGGIGFGILWGVISNYAPEKHDPFAVPLRVLLLLVGGTVAVFGSECIGYGGAGPLGCVTAAFASLVAWSRNGWEIEDNPAATAFEIFWMIFEPILFGITGASIKLNKLNSGVVAISLGILISAVIIRMICTVVIGIGCKFNLKEKIFIAVACMAKATVQAALGPVVLGIVATDSEEHDYADKILTMCVLSIMVTAPTGAILITLLGPRLLTKTKIPNITEGWRRSHRPSIRDISIIDEEEERDNNIDTTVETTDTKTTSDSIKQDA